MILVVLCVTLLISGGMAIYLHINPTQEENYKNGMFVDRGDEDGYEKMHDLYTLI